MQSKMLAMAILATLTASCDSNPVKPVPLPLVPEPTIQKLTQEELDMLKSCFNDKKKDICAIYKTTILKIFDAGQDYKAAYREADKILKSTHEWAKNMK